MMTSKILRITSPHSVIFDRNEIGPYFVITAFLYNNAFIISLQVGKQNRSYLVTKQFSEVSFSLARKVRVLEKYADIVSFMLLVSFPFNLLFTPLVFNSIKNYNLLIYTLFIFGICFCFVLGCLSVVTTKVLKIQLMSIINSNNYRKRREPLNKAILESQNELILSVLLQEKVQLNLCVSNGIYTILFISLNMPFQYILHPYNYCFLCAGEILIIVKPFSLVCKTEKEKKYKKRAIFP